MCRDIGVPLLVSLIFLHIVKIVPTYNDGSVHFGTVACTCYDATSNRNITSEWAFLINVGSFNGLSRSLEAKANALPVSIPTFARPLSFPRFFRA